MERINRLFKGNEIGYKTVVPIPYLAVPTYPLRLNDELVLDRLSEDEVNRCYQVGVLRANFMRSPIITTDVTVGIRRTMSLTKVIGQGNEPSKTLETGDEGNFGQRPHWRDDLVVDDVLTAMRLFKSTQIRAAGFACWTDSPWLAGMTAHRELGRWPYGGRFVLSEDDVQKFLDLWHLLEEGAAHFSFSIHRFNLAFDRGLIADRIVDLVITAEALFLGDLDDVYRGELRFRFGLRAAKFIESSRYTEHEVFRVMRLAYDARSAILHSSSPKSTRLPDNRAADLTTFANTIEDLVRLGVRKALSMKNGSRIRRSEYWESLVLS